MASASGASQGGALTQLIALGAADKYLTQNPSITYWRFRYNRYTNFSMEAIEQQFNTSVRFGADTNLTLNRTGDLIFYTYVLIDLKGITACTAGLNGCPTYSGGFPGLTGGANGYQCDPCQDTPMIDDALDACCEYPQNEATPWAHYTNAIGQWLVRRASLIIGGQVVDTLYNDYLYMWEELSGKPGKKLVEMIGKSYSLDELVITSAQDRRLYVPLPFWFTQTSGNALPVVSLQFHGIQLQVSFAELRSCVQTSNSSTALQPSPPVTVIKYDRTPLTENDLKALVETTYVYLDIDERDRFATGSFEQLITQVQAYEVQTSSSQVRIALNFNHPIIELIWAVRRKCQANINNWFCYGGKFNQDPIKMVNLKLNNLPRFQTKEGRYFRLVQPYQHHTNIPISHVYSWSAAIHPEEAQPSGSVNFSRIDNVELIFEMQDTLNIPTKVTGTGSHSTGDFSVLVYGRSWNIMRYKEGLGGLAYSN